MSHGPVVAACALPAPANRLATRAPVAATASSVRRGRVCAMLTSSVAKGQGEKAKTSFPVRRGSVAGKTVKDVDVNVNVGRAATERNAFWSVERRPIDPVERVDLRRPDLDPPHHDGH